MLGETTLAFLSRYYDQYIWAKSHAVNGSCLFESFLAFRQLFILLRSRAKGKVDGAVSFYIMFARVTTGIYLRVLVGSMATYWVSRYVGNKDTVEWGFATR
jgi:hypothetical protein